MELLILGASARSAASSALRLGLKPICADLFGDADLAAFCSSIRVDPANYPDNLDTFADSLEPTPWLYTGAIENRPDLVERISTRHPLLGNDSSTLRAVRDPLRLAEAVREEGLGALAVRVDPTGIPRDGSWLSKPIASGGGRGIRPYLGDQLATGRSVYYQERIAGLPLAAIYAGQGGRTSCLGITRQFVGRPGNRFAYRGSLGPWPAVREVQEQIERLGFAIGSSFGLRGLFGVDLILSDGRVWPIEVNPRYTASVEILEWALGRSLLAEHLLAFGHKFEARPDSERVEGFAGKAILFADRTGCWSPAESLQLTEPGRFPEIADVPQAGTRFRTGDPVMTVFARGCSLDNCRRNLAERIRLWRTRIRDVTN